VKAVLLAGVGDLRVAEVAEPRIVEPSDAIVRVTTTGLCGADLFPYHGQAPGFEDGTILGHEFVGVVEEVGGSVTRLGPGDRVVSTSTISCGACGHCRADRPSQCLRRALFGYSGVYQRLDGGQAERVRVPFADRSLFRVPADVDDDAAVLVADMLPTGYSAVRRAEVSLGDLVAVVGCGTVGLMATLFAVRLARTVIAVDGIAARRELAARFGATAVSPEEVADAVADATEGLGADAVIEAAGAPAALTAAIRLVRGLGTVSVVGAHFEPDFPLDNGRLFEREMTLRVTWGHGFADRERLLGLLSTGAIDPRPVITHRFGLEQAADAYRVFDAREAVKVLLRP
jgi:threonine dehydrogenase-like Zn-dependent dehydrogenase